MAFKSLIIYLVIVNVVAFVLYGVDKYKSKRQMWRIPERTLLLLAAIGGAAGAYTGMLTFRHKTKHLRFNTLVPLFLLIWVVIVYFVYNGSFKL